MQYCRRRTQQKIMQYSYGFPVLADERITSLQCKLFSPAESNSTPENEHTTTAKSNFTPESHRSFLLRSCSFREYGSSFTTDIKFSQIFFDAILQKEDTTTGHAVQSNEFVVFADQRITSLQCKLYSPIESNSTPDSLRSF